MRHCSKARNEWKKRSTWSFGKGYYALTENKQGGRPRWHCDDELKRSNKGAGKGNQKRRDAWAGKGRGKEPETDGVNCFCSTLRRTPLNAPCDNANVARVKEGYTPSSTLRLTLTAHHGGKALMALGNLVVIKFNMLNTNYCYVSRFTLSNVTRCQCLVPPSVWFVASPRCPSLAGHREDATLKCPSRKVCTILMANRGQTAFTCQQEHSILCLSWKDKESHSCE